MRKKFVSDILKSTTTMTSTSSMTKTSILSMKINLEWAVQPKDELLIPSEDRPVELSRYFQFQECQINEHEHNLWERPKQQTTTC